MHGLVYYLPGRNQVGAVRNKGASHVFQPLPSSSAFSCSVSMSASAVVAAASPPPPFYPSPTAWSCDPDQWTCDQS